jgi:hypothetical protein
MGNLFVDGLLIITVLCTLGAVAAIHLFAKEAVAVVVEMTATPVIHSATRNDVPPPVKMSRQEERGIFLNLLAA